MNRNSPPGPGRGRPALTAAVALATLVVGAPGTAAPPGSWIARPHPAPERHSQMHGSKHLQRLPLWTVYANGPYSGAAYSGSTYLTPVAPAETRTPRSTYGPIVRRDSCTPKVYVIDPDDGSVTSHCGQGPLRTD